MRVVGFIFCVDFFNLHKIKKIPINILLPKDVPRSGGPVIFQVSSSNLFQKISSSLKKWSKNSIGSRSRFWLKIIPILLCLCCSTETPPSLLVKLDKYENESPTLLDSLIGQKMLFKVETRVEPAMQFDGSYPVRRICIDGDIISMFELPGADLTPSKVIFAPLFQNLSNEIADLEEPFSAETDVHVATISFRDDDICSSSRVTHAKRKLEAEFLSCKLGYPSAGAISDSSVQGGEHVKPVSGLVVVKVEKED